MTKPVDYKKLTSLAANIEAELKSIGVWSNEDSLPEEKFKNMGTFGINTMALVEWLQYVLLPTIHDKIKNKKELPSNSMIGVHAVREFDGDSRYSYLCDLLIQLDELANGYAQSSFITWFDH